MTSGGTTSRAGGIAGIVRSALLFLLLLFTLDYGIGSSLCRFYFRQSSGEQYRTTYSMERTTAGILVFGTSRANHHYVPSVFEEGLGDDFYNAGRDGSSILYHYAVLAGVLARHTPRAVVLDITPAEFARSRAPYERLTALLPYYDTHPEVRPVVLLKSRFERLKLLSRIYPFNSSLLTIAMGNLEANRKRKPDIKGYIPLRGRWGGPPGKAELAADETIDPALVRHFARFLVEARARGIRLHVVVSPAYREPGPPSRSLRIAGEICEKHGAAFSDFTSSACFFDRSDLFQDPYHLNHEGAVLFSERIVEEILRERGSAGGEEPRDGR
ncbi:MAG: hypothetical protein ABIH26_13900 [Candidatus Eisenbacteria bacterium]